MAAPALNNVYQVRIYCYDTPPTQVSINTVYLKITNAAGVGTMSEQSMCNQLDVLWAARYKPCLANGATYFGLTVQRVDIPTPLPISLFSKGNTGAGTGGAGTLPNQVAGLISLKTQNAGRHYRGRIYTPFLPVSASDANGLMTAAYVAILQADIASSLQSIEGIVSGANTVSGLYQVRTRIKVVGPPVSFITSYNPVLVGQAIQRFATQRRRGQYGRNNPIPF